MKKFAYENIHILYEQKSKKGGIKVSDSYYIGSTGGANLEVIEEYIKKQGQPKRKYVRKK